MGRRGRVIWNGFPPARAGKAMGRERIFGRSCAFGRKVGKFVKDDMQNFFVKLWFRNKPHSVGLPLRQNSQCCAVCL